jgi:hypothetical protein
VTLLYKPLSLKEQDKDLGSRANSRVYQSISAIPRFNLEHRTNHTYPYDLKGKNFPLNRRGATGTTLDRLKFNKPMQFKGQFFYPLNHRG